MLPDPSLAIDLSQLPAPQVLQALDFEALVDARIADLQARWPEFDTPLESDPAIKLIQVEAWRELLTRAAINDAAKSVMVAFASGADLDHLAAFFDLPRRILVPASDEAPAVMESDAEFRARIQIAPETLPHAGVTAGFYRARALALAPEVKDVAAIKREGGRIDVVLLGRDGDGTVEAGTVSTIAAAFTEDDAVQLTDIVTVRSAEIVPYNVALTLLLGKGPDPALVQAAAEAAVRAYAESRHRIGKPVFAQMVAAAASVGGVEQAIVEMDDIEPGTGGAAWLNDLAIAFEQAP